MTVTKVEIKTLLDGPAGRNLNQDRTGHLAFGVSGNSVLKIKPWSPYDGVKIKSHTSMAASQAVEKANSTYHV